MRLLIQRVSRAAVRVADHSVAAIGPGLLILVGVGRGERPDEVERLARKTAALRIFEDDDGKMNRSVLDTGGEERVEDFAVALEREGVPVRRGAFQEHMQVELVNDGPVTILVDGSEA